jgi:molybdenum cofactor guanylyltransferase
VTVTAPASNSRGAIVLAGGRSTRMGRDKASLPFGDGTLLSRVVGVLARVVPEIVVVARRDQRLPALPPLPKGVVLRTAHDEVEGQGPLGGLVPGLVVLEGETAYVSSCDVPFLSEAFVRRMFDLLGHHDVAMPEADGHFQPLASVVRRDAVRGPAAALLAEGRLRPVYLLERVAHVVVPAERLRDVDPELLSLANLNTPDAYEAARARLEGQGGA